MRVYFSSTGKSSRNRLDRPEYLRASGTNIDPAARTLYPHAAAQAVSPVPTLWPSATVYAIEIESSRIGK